MKRIVIDGSKRYKNTAKNKPVRKVLETEPRGPEPIEPNEIIPITVYLYKHNFVKNLEDIRYTFFDGYSQVRDFYDKRPQRENYVPARGEHYRTLYWNPNIETNQNGKVQISFYNTSFCREIDVNAEGITNQGIPFSSK